MKNLLYWMLVLTLACTSIFFYLQYDKEKDKKITRQTSRSTTTTTSATTTSTSSTTSTPQTTSATVDIIALNNDSNKTTARLNTEYAGKIITQQISTTVSITETIIDINNVQYQELGNQIAATLKGKVGTTPVGAPISEADLVVYVAN